MPDMRNENERTRSFSGGFKLILALLALVMIPIVLFKLVLPVGVMAGLLVDQFARAGSATGPEALARMENALHDLGDGRWRHVAINPGAQWGAPDMGGDQIEHYSFSLPADEVAHFEAALKAEWVRRPLEGHQLSHPRVNYIFEGASLVLDRETGRVEIEWANFFSLTPATQPSRHAGQSPAAIPTTAPATF